jgi:hypothetical protein
MRRLQLVASVGVVAIGNAWLGVAAAGAVTNGPTTRDCSLLAFPPLFAGLDPDFIQLSGANVGPGGTLTAAGPTVQLLGSESLTPMDQMGHVTFNATVSAPGTTTSAFHGAGTGHVAFTIPLAAGNTYTVSWSATFDDGFHACPSLLTTANSKPMPFVVRAAPNP